VGRFVPVEPDVSVPSRKWPGWTRFEENVNHAVFLYDAVMDPKRLTDLLGTDANVHRSRLTGFVWSWRMVDDVDGPPHSLRPTVLRQAESTVEGVLVMVEAAQLPALDMRYPGYDRIKVTQDVRMAGGGATTSDVVWTYVARPAGVARADAAIASGATQFDGEYLHELREAFGAYAGLTEALNGIPLPEGVPTVAPVLDAEAGDTSPAETPHPGDGNAHPPDGG
jgi:hypothetical protein